MGLELLQLVSWTATWACWKKYCDAVEDRVGVVPLQSLVDDERRLRPLEEQVDLLYLQSDVGVLQSSVPTDCFASVLKTGIPDVTYIIAKHLHFL